MLNWRQLVRDITGPSLFYTPSYLFVLPVLWLTSVLSNAHWSSLPNLAGWTIANVISLALCWALITLANRTFFAGRTEKHLVAILLFSAFIGAFKGATTTIFGFCLGVEPQIASLIWGRVIQTALMGLVTIPALAVLASTRVKFQQLRDALVSERAAIAAKDGQLEAISNEDFLRLANQLAEVRDQLEVNASIEVPSLLRDIVQNGLRPVTHRLWEREESKQTNFTLRDLSRVAVVTRPFVPTPVALILFFGTLGPYIQASNIQQGFARSLLTAASIFVGYLLARTWKPKSVPASWSYLVLVHIFISAFVVLTSKLFFGTLEGFTDESAFLLLLVWILQTGYMTSFIAGALDTHAKMRGQLEQLSISVGIDRDVLQARSLLNKREMANFLHSDLQNKLLSLALRIENGASNAQNAKLELAQIETLLLQGATSDKPQLRLNEALQELVDRWEGFVQITFDLHQAEDLNSKETILVINEAVSNSVRHGLATKIDIKIDKVSQGHSIEIWDDGIGPRSGPKGLGSRFFDSVAGSRWSLVAASTGGSLLRLEL